MESRLGDAGLVWSGLSCRIERLHRKVGGTCNQQCGTQQPAGMLFFADNLDQLDELHARAACFARPQRYSFTTRTLNIPRLPTLYLAQLRSSTWCYCCTNKPMNQRQLPAAQHLVPGRGLPFAALCLRLICPSERRFQGDDLFVV